MKLVLTIILSFFFGFILIQCGSDKKQEEIEKQIPSQSTRETTQVTDQKNTPCVKSLVEACKKNDIDQAVKLIDGGCDVNGTASIKSNYLVSPLWYSSAWEDTTVLIKLLESGADPNLDLGDNYSPLTYAASFNATAVRILIEHGADVNYFNENAPIQTPLIAAIRRNGLKQLKLLVENGAQTTYQDLKSEKKIKDPIHTAISRQLVEVTEYLLRNGADHNTKITEEYEDCSMCPLEIAPIHTAASSLRDPESAIAIIDLLEEAGSDLLARNGFGQNALTYIATSRSGKIAEHLIQKGIPITDSTVVRAAMYQNEEFLSVLMKYGGNPNAQAYNGSAIYHALTCCGDGFNDRPVSARKKTIQILVDNGGTADEITLELIKDDEK